MNSGAVEMSTPTLEIAGALATITLRRPEESNRLHPADLVSLVEHIDTVNRNVDVRVLQFASTGKHFCTGYNIDQLGASRTVEFEDVANALEDARPVTVAVLQGGVYGGATDLALACDFRIGTPAVSMFMPAAKLGLHYYERGMQRYVSRLGLNTAKRLFLTAEQLDAAELKAVGFLTHLVEQDALTKTADSLSRKIAALAPIAVQGMKRQLNLIARDALDSTDFQAGFQRAAQSTDLREGRTAFAEKRAPRFTGQ